MGDTSVDDDDADTDTADANYDDNDKEDQEESFAPVDRSTRVVESQRAAGLYVSLSRTVRLCLRVETTLACIHQCGMAYSTVV
jgi:hypothetical protein